MINQSVTPTGVTDGVINMRGTIKCVDQSENPWGVRWLIGWIVVYVL